MKALRSAVVAIAVLFSNTFVSCESQTDPRTFISELGNRAIDIIKTKGITSEQVAQEFKKLLQANFAMDGISKFALGKYNKELIKKGNKQAFDDCFMNMLVKVYSSRFNEYKTAKFNVYSAKKKSEKQTLVSSKISIVGKEDIDVVWSVYKINGEWKIYDVIISEVSMSQIQRTDIIGRIVEIGLDKFITEFTLKYQTVK